MNGHWNRCGNQNSDVEQAGKERIGLRKEMKNEQWPTAGESLNERGRLRSTTCLDIKEVDDATRGRSRRGKKRGYGCSGTSRKSMASRITKRRGTDRCVRPHRCFRADVFYIETDKLSSPNAFRTARRFLGCVHFVTTPPIELFRWTAQNSFV